MKSVPLVIYIVSATLLTVFAPNAAVALPVDQAWQAIPSRLLEYFAS